MRSHQSRREWIKSHLEEKGRIEQELKRAGPELINMICQKMTARDLADRLRCSAVWLSTVRRGQERMRLSGRPVKLSMEMYCKLFEIYEES